MARSRSRNRNRNRNRNRSRGGNKNNAPKAPPEPIRGLFEQITGKPFGFVRQMNADLRKGDRDPFFPPALVQKYRIRDGVLIEGSMVPARRGDMQIHEVTRIMGVPPGKWARTKPFDGGTSIYPKNKFNLITGPRDYIGRVIDLAVPIGKGQRALIVAPPKTGKTVMLKHIATALAANHPDVEVVALLVDERPEEVTDFKRTTTATVFASSNDRAEDNHVRVATLAFEHAKRHAELRKDVVLLVDSLTRLGRVYNDFSGGGRTLSGGLDSGALKQPRRMFGSARNIENGGSLTIIATALIDTGSKMDQVIYEEFKGTGNAEIALDRIMADKRIFPTINLWRTGTRNEERLQGKESAQIQHLLRILQQRAPHDAMEALISHMNRMPSNKLLVEELIGEYSSY